MINRQRFLSLLFAFSTLAILLTLACPLFSQPSERYFDQTGPLGNETRLVIFYPSLGSLQALLALQENGFIDLKGIIVVGVFSSRENTNYEQSYRLVQEKNWTNFHFHRVEREFSPQDLFKKNPLSEELAAIFQKSSGIIFFGGPDIPPSIYGEKTSFLTRIEDPWRHYLELTAIFHLLGGYQDDNFQPLLASRPDYPILGICLGAQSLNVATGGSLTQDIPTEIYGLQSVEDLIALGESAWHTNPYYLLNPDRQLKLFAHQLHPIRLLVDGKFCREMGFSPEDHPLVLSAHHQQVKRPGKGFKSIATSLDGRVSEAFEHEQFPNVLAIQFHPEFSVLWDSQARFRFTPGDKELSSLRSRLEAAPPSLNFHRKLWSWFMSRLTSRHKP